MNQPDFSLAGQVAVVTGASMGIGYGLARAVAAAGAKIAAVARSRARLETLIAEIEADGGEAAAFELDVRDTAAIARVFDAIRTRFGRIDILVNNAGLGDNHPAEAVTEADWDAMMDVNLKGAFFVAQAAGRIMLAEGSGRIVNMSSQASSVGIRDHAVYCATKGGMDQFTRVMALEWGHRGVTVNAVAPTFIYTPGTAERLDQPDYLKTVLDRIPGIHVRATSPLVKSAPMGGPAQPDYLNAVVRITTALTPRDRAMSL
ncbi:MAG: SDR family NAD(P)-dependent oxidoreductase, partial [Exilibacterium sp.]